MKSNDLISIISPAFEVLDDWIGHLKSHKLLLFTLGSCNTSFSMCHDIGSAKLLHREKIGIFPSDLQGWKQGEQFKKYGEGISLYALRILIGNKNDSLVQYCHCFLCTFLPYALPSTDICLNISTCPFCSGNRGSQVQGIAQFSLLDILWTTEAEGGICSHFLAIWSDCPP